jgi:alpha-D-ribose 1-methylphosphonate 5-triphosphate synthase subunit PhnL
VLSGGEQQRVNLAAGTLCPPRLLLLDEPVASLDARNRDSVLDLVVRLTAQGVAVLSVFHDLEAVRVLATRVILLRDGQVVADGEPAAVLQSAA